MATAMCSSGASHEEKVDECPGKSKANVLMPDEVGAPEEECIGRITHADVNLVEENFAHHDGDVEIVL